MGIHQFPSSFSDRRPYLCSEKNTNKKELTRKIHGHKILIFPGLRFVSPETEILPRYQKRYYQRRNLSLTSFKALGTLFESKSPCWGSKLRNAATGKESSREKGHVAAGSGQELSKEDQGKLLNFFALSFLYILKKNHHQASFLP